LHGESSILVGTGSLARRRRSRTRRLRRFSAAHVAWTGVLRVLQKITHHRRSDRREFKLSFSVRDLVSEKGRAVKAQFEALVQAVQKAGSYPAREDAARAVHAVMDALKERVPPDTLSRIADSTPVKQAARRGRAAAQLFQRDNGKNGSADNVIAEEPVVRADGSAGENETPEAS